MPRKIPEPELDFNIYVDPSCLSTPMDEETPATMPPPPEEVQEPAMVAETPEDPAAEAAPETVEQVADDAASGAAEEAQDPPAEAEVTPPVEAVTEEQPEAETAKQEPVAADEQQENTADDAVVDEPAPDTEDAAEVSTAEATPDAEPSLETEAVPEAEDAPVAETPFEELEQVEEPAAEPEATESEATEQAASDEPSPESETEAATEPEQVEEAAVEDPVSQPDDAENPPQPDEAPAAEAEQEDILPVEAPSEPATDIEPQEAPEAAAEESDAPQGGQPEEASCKGDQEPPTEDADNTQPQEVEVDVDDESGHPQPTLGHRKTSLRTEALIQAAARAVVAKIERRKSGEPADEEDDHDNSLLSTDSQETYVLGDDARSTYSEHQPPSRRESSGSQQQPVRHIPSRSTSSDDTGDSSSPHEADDDLFSDRSARSSIYSLDCHDSDTQTKTPQPPSSLSRRDSYNSSTSTTHSPRTVSNFSTISGLSQYEKDLSGPFIPTTRETRMPFRTPSEIRAMHLASPTPSIYGGGNSSPVPAIRSAKRHSGHVSSPNISRITSPTVSAQYSPKNRSTPPRFKAAARRAEEAPLVLLHVTLLPLRWGWGEVVNGLDAIAVTTTNKESPAVGENDGQKLFEPSEQLRALRDAWRELQDRVGDTVLERGVLLPHPQNDYEVLEERLLEALELPVRRRARILECGHYLGPANFTEGEDEEEDGDRSEDEGAEGRGFGGKHWCGTCREEIRFEKLGPGKVFRVKVYASNGLMRAGAWEACWKEMERVDVEVEPIVEAAVQGELERLAALQLELEEQRRQEMELAVRSPEPEAERKRESSLAQDSRAPSRQLTDLPSEHDRDRMSSPAPSALQLSLHASSLPAASPSTSLVRADTPTSYPLDTSEDRRRRDEERMREIYGDMPPAAAPAPTPAQLPAPSAPVEQQPQQSQQQTQLYQPIAPPPQQPLALPMLTDGSSLHHRHQQNPHDPYNTTADPYAQDRRNRPDQSQKRPAIVLDENSGFVELLMEAFKVLLRDPKNVAIIVLCVFLVVLMKSPGMGFTPAVQQQQAKEVVVKEVPTVGVAEGYYDRFESERRQVQQQQQQGVASEEVPKVHVAEVVSEMVEEVQQEVSSSPAAEVDEVVARVLASITPEAMSLGEVVAAVSPSEVEVVEEVEEPIAEELQPEVPAENSEVEVSSVAEEVPEHETAQEVETLSFDHLVDVCFPRGLEYPMTMADDVPTADEEEIVEVQEAELESSSASETLPVMDNETEQAVEGDSTTANDDAETMAENPDAETPASASMDETLSTAEDNTDAAESSEKPTSQCNADADPDVDLDSESDSEHDDLPAPSAQASSSSLSIPGPFVTERKTVRVFETVTETVRVSVVTQTETVSTVVTAVPQTVEETVYETETVRITVSVPVEEQMKAKAARAKASKGCKDAGKKGWF